MEGEGMRGEGEEGEDPLDLPPPPSHGKIS